MKQAMMLLPPLDTFIPQDHSLRKLNLVLDLSFVHEAVRLFEADSLRQGQRIEFGEGELAHSLSTLSLVDDFVGSLDTVCIRETNPGLYEIRAVNLTDMASFTKYQGLAASKIGLPPNNFIVPAYPRKYVQLIGLDVTLGTPGGQTSQVYKMTIRR